MINHITIDGVRSNPLLRFDKLPLFPMAKQISKSYNAGGDDVASYLLEQYEDISVQLTAHIIGGRSIHDVYAFLHSGRNLTLSTQPDVHCRIKSIGDVQPDRIGWNAHKIVIPLTLAPFKFAVENPEIELENGGYVYNRGTIYSRPIWRLYNVQSPVYLNVNGEQLEINCEGGETVVIDTQRMVVYSGVDVILSKTSGNLPLLNVEMNQISWTGDVDRVTLQKNERWL